MDTLDPIALEKWSGGEWRNGRPRAIQGLCNDTRRLSDGELFIALATPARDGHDFLEAAAAKGATGAVVQRFRGDCPLPQLVVPDVGRALLQMAGAYRRGWSVPVVGVTGSCGKTTCKELLALVLGKDTTHCTAGNLNNLIGVPMSILRPEAAAARHVALEAGISEPGEMERLAMAIDPDWVVITAIGPAHLQELGTEANVAREKGKLAQGARVKAVFAGETCEPYVKDLGGSKVFLVKRDDALEREWGYRCVESEGGTELRQRVLGKVESYFYPGVGEAMASNVALAIAVARSLNVSPSDLERGLAQWRDRNLRGQWIERGRTRIFADCYNANPLSMRAALKTFVRHTDPALPRLFVVGCMEELGSASSAFHEELGADFPFREGDLLLVLGAEAPSLLRGMERMGHDLSRCRQVDGLEEVKLELERFAGSVFLKGSRRYRLEAALEGAASRDGAEGGGARC